MIEQGELIERWSHGKDVLVAMPEHERQRHWNMARWGQVTECGTIACFAGHCGLNPWFRDRGFTLEFQYGEAVISNVNLFFGSEGSHRIFLNTDQRSVETVIGEVDVYIEELRRIAALNATPGLPKIGEVWSEQGGGFAGARLGVGGTPDYYLIAGPEHGDYVSWREGIKWASEIVVQDHRDFTLPSRVEQCALFDRVRGLFQPAYYWSCEEHASGSGFAWYQDFDGGGQYYWHKGLNGRARAVRRLTIQ